MRNLGILLIIVGVGVFVLPLVGLQFRGLNQLDEGTRKVVAIAAAGIGLLLTVVGHLRVKAAARRAKQG